jgi:hypothetical protein
MGYAVKKEQAPARRLLGAQASCLPLLATLSRQGCLRSQGALRRGLRWTVGIGPWPIRKTAMSALLLHSATRLAE